MYDEGRVVLDTDNHPIKDYRDIPLTVSSEVEGGLTEAIRHVDPRITHGDIWARSSVFPVLVLGQQKLTSNSPEKYGKGGILSHNALSSRASQFRLVNCIPARKERAGTKEIRDFIRGLMSPAAIAANSTRELSKLSGAQLEQVQKLSKGKHDANVGGYGLKDAPRAGPAPCKARKAVEKNRKPASSKSHKNISREVTCELDFHEDIVRQPPSFAPEQGQLYQCQTPHSFTLNTQYTSPDPFSGAPYGYAPLDPSSKFCFANNDFRPLASSSTTYENMLIGPAFATPVSYVPQFDPWEGSSSGTGQYTLNTPTNGTNLSTPSPLGEFKHQYIPPQPPQDVQYIQEAPITTHTGVMSDWPPTTTTADQSYMFQLGS